MARPAGFEPTTPWFVARYSIQLSYGRVKKQALNHSVVSQTVQVGGGRRQLAQPRSPSRLRLQTGIDTDLRYRIVDSAPTIFLISNILLTTHLIIID